MATDSSIIAWEIPWTEEPGGLQSTGSKMRWTQLSSYTTTITRCEWIKQTLPVHQINQHFRILLVLLHFNSIRKDHMEIKNQILNLQQRIIWKTFFNCHLFTTIKLVWKISQIWNIKLSKQTIQFWYSSKECGYAAARWVKSKFYTNSSADYFFTSLTQKQVELLVEIKNI